MAKQNEKTEKNGSKSGEIVRHPTKLHESFLAKPAYHRTKADRYDAGKKLRLHCPPKSHSELNAHDRPNPIDLLIESGASRNQELLPIRYGRMSVSPFTFYRGAAAIMASDLSRTPTTGYYVQACGDCHLANFGAFATAEHRIVFDVNDFDETYPAPWEWDLKRLAASFVIACQNNGFSADDTHFVARHLVQCYNQKMHELAEMPVLEAWAYIMDYQELIKMFKDKKLEKISKKQLSKAQKVDGIHEMIKMAHVVHGQPKIIDVPPLIFHSDEQAHPGFIESAHRTVKKYQSSLPIERRILLDKYELADIAMKVVGVGSVGTFCAAALFFAGENDPLFLQIKEAQRSVLEPYVNQRSFISQGERVVYGQRIMQAAGDIFLGHLIGDVSGRHYYIRKLHDVKIKPMIESFNVTDMLDYARYCGWTLARAHGRSADPAIIAGYMGKGKEIAEAIADFSFAYADLNLRDHHLLLNAIKAKIVPAKLDIE
ncbi:DUF2252 domain-containing protein [Candidatus Paracaedibacter symbiosus]|uniref:DUF2252 domain-containing protein n=1 Tax=Candidatus Paracaedibacter symbiosus TaxID=244582 RepID=UPI000A02F715|nr:DUF2252 domain-containing protein [Candidatus Paracaedibacter symbiosus]